MSRFIFYFSLCTILLSSCSRSTPVPLGTPIPPEQEKAWTVRMDQSGGIMGLSRSIEVSSDGKFTITDQRANKMVKGQLSSGDLTRLRQMLTTIKSTSIPEPNQSGCADCFIYTIEIQGTGTPFSIRLDDVTLPNSGLESLVAFLRGLMDKSLT
jgi:hypothetical protein